MKKEEKTLRDHYRIMENLFFIGLGIMVAATLFPDGIFPWIVMFLGFCICVAACIYHNKYVKCPHCGSKLHVRGIPKYCPDCGKELV